MRLLLCCLVLQVGLSLCLAHDNTTVHPRITASAAESSIGLQNFLSDECVDTDGMGTDLLIAGSMFEDIPFTRGFNHFYDPTKHPAIGLTDGFDWYAYPSFRWATEDLIQFRNQSYPWRLVRAYELDALTNRSQVVRQNSLNLTMFCLGHVLHLNQDLSVPAHVRNDNHGLTLEHGWRETKIMWTETYGQNHCADNPQWFANQSQHGWSWWQTAAGFQKLEDFWNRDMLRTNGVKALNDEAGGNVYLGLSEFCNGNFISEDARYKETIGKTNAKHYFQYPSLETGTQFPDVRKNPTKYVQTSRLSNGALTNRIVIRKIADGITVSNHSVLNYLGAKFPTKAKDLKRAVTLHDDNVLQEYHEKLIPKAEEYSAGILDYFFRGTMDLKVIGYDTNLMQYTNLIVNTSGQDFGRGTYSAYCDDTNDVRTLIGQTNRLSPLPNGQSFKMTMSKPESLPKIFLLVYQGSIGVDGHGNALDLVDSNICVAAKSFSITNEQIRTYVYWEPTNVVGTAITNTLESDDFDFTPTPGNFEVFINFAKFDDTGTIGRVEPTDGPSSCTILNEIYDTLVPLEQVTVVSNRLSVEVTAVDDPACGQYIGWWEITITWRAWPAP